MRSPLDVARNPQPYQIPLYYPPFPAVINQQPKQSGVQRAVASALRDYQNINAAELRRLRGNLTAYRQEAQTAFRQKVAFPKATAIPQTEPPFTPNRDAVRAGLVIPDPPKTEPPFTPNRDAVRAGLVIPDPPPPYQTDPESDISSGTTAAEPDSDYVPSSESELMRRAGAGAGRLTEPEQESTDDQSFINLDTYGGAVVYSPTDISDFEGLTSGTSVGRGAGGGGFKKVSFGDMDLTSAGESDFAPRATQSERKARRTKKYVDNASNRRLGRVGKSY